MDNIIAKAYGKDRVIDFRDCLNPPLLDNYAAVHAVGDKSKRVFPSLIKIAICDFSHGKGNASTTVFANIEPSVIVEWFEVVKQNVAPSLTLSTLTKEKKVGGKPWETVLVPNELAGIHYMIYAMRSITSGLSGWFSGLFNGMSRHTAPADTALQNIFSAAAADQYPVNTVSIPAGRNYKYQQDKVDSYREGSDGFAPVNRLTVTCTPFRPDGDLSQYPWTIKIMEAEARTKHNANGSINFDSRSMRNQREVYINLSNRDMMRMMHRCIRFIELWELNFSAPVLFNGENQRLTERATSNN